ncbi:MAG: hypothetical protein M3R60_04050 [Pseudomonadota bacterium]|nr:hypothetical protein [Pseudomonadota bacterium]
MELFFMMTAMLALLGPIALGRVRCIRIAPRLLDLVNRHLQTASHADHGARRPCGPTYVAISDSTSRMDSERRIQQQRPRYLAGLLRVTPFYSHSTP